MTPVLLHIADTLQGNLHKVDINRDITVIDVMPCNSSLVEDRFWEGPWTGPNP